VLPLTWRAAPAWTVAALVALLALFLANTRPLEANGGLGYDGQAYAAMTAWRRGDTSVVPWSPYAYRVLPSAVVAASGLEVRTGFFALNAAALIAAGLVLLAILRRAGASPGRAVLLVTWSALLTHGLRHAVIYPVLVDGVGTLLFVSLVLLAQRRGAVAFAALLVPAVLVREHMILFAPLAVPDPRSWRRTVAVALPAAIALVIVHIAPPYPVRGEGTLVYVLVNSWTILTNASDEVLHLAAAPFVTLGVLLAVPLAAPRATIELLRRPGWGLTVFLIVLTGTIGGLDHDRYFVWLAPFLLLAAVRLTWSPFAGAAVTVLQAVAVHALVPLDGSERAYFAFALRTMSLDDLATWTATTLAATLLAAFFLRRSLRPPTALAARA
jgi:hypothetical protein